MGKLSHAFIQQIERKEQFVATLDAFIQNISVPDGLHREEAQGNVAESLVEVTYCGRHSSNGLLITDDGYFLTAWHCVRDDGNHPLEKARVRLYDGTTYPIEKRCASAKSDDLAIVKAAIPKACTPRNYRFYNTNVLVNDEVLLLSRWRWTLIVKDGSITQANSVITVPNSDRPDDVYHNHFLTSHASIPGDSGGTITTLDGRVAGLVSGGNYYKTCSVKIINALKLIDRYKRGLQKSLG